MFEKEFIKEKVKISVLKAAKGHTQKKEVKEMLNNIETYCDNMVNDILSGEYIKRLEYKKMEIKHNDDKIRNIDSPSLDTRVLQHTFISIIEPYYKQHDTGDALNCKSECGITASVKKNSIVHRLKHIIYDRQDLEYGFVIDQRKCYEHITKKVFRKKLKKLIKDKWFIDFAVNVVFTKDGRFPIGTPSSPISHHIIMLDMDKMIHEFAPVYLRYADNLFLASDSKEDLQRAKWRVINWWWYDLGMRAKSSSIRIFKLSEGLDFCGYRVFRNNNKGICIHNKGYTIVRKRTGKRMLRCKNEKAWPSYYGLLKHADSYNFIKKINKMRLTELVEKNKITRGYDADVLDTDEFKKNDIKFTLYKYDISADGKKKYIYRNGFIFKDSTNKIEYIDEIGEKK